MGESAAGQHLGRHLPQRAIDRDVLPTHIPNRGDPSDPQQAAPQEVLLDAVQRASKVLSRVLAAPAIEEYRCGHAGLAGLGIPEGERPFGEAVPFLRGELAPLHALELHGQDLRPLGDPERVRHHAPQTTFPRWATLNGHGATWSTGPPW